MSTDTNTSQLIINKLTKAQYEAIASPSDTELYLTPDTTAQDIADAVSTHNNSNSAHSSLFNAKQDSLTSENAGKNISITGNILPSGYTELEYIESTGTQYIDAGFQGACTFKATAQYTTSVGSSRVLVVGNSSAGSGSWFGQYANVWGAASALSSIASTTKAVIDINFTTRGWSGTVNDESLSRTASVTFNNNWLLFSLNGTRHQSWVKLFNAQFIQNNVLIRNFVPAERNSDSEIGMYDTVTDTFFTNQGTDAFTAGEEVADRTIISFNGTIPNKISNLTDDTATNPIDKADTLTDLTATVAELNYCDGVTSNIQTQLDSKQATLVSGTNIKTINSTSLLGSGDIEIQATPDNETISLNSDDELQAIGVMDARDNSTPLKTWTGTKAQYDAITTKDDNTIYNVTDDQGAVSSSVGFVNITGQPTDNTNLATALNNKQNTLTAGNLISLTNNTVAFTGTIPTKISDLTDDTATNPIDKADTLTGLTATASELNVLDGITATTAELNYCDGVTSNIQTQLDSKQASLPTMVSGNYLTNNGSTLSWGTISTDTNGVFQDISALSSGTITIDSTKSVYSKTIAENTTFTFDVSGLGTLTNKAVTFELFLTRTAGTITFPSSVTWIDEPDFTTTGKYLVVFKTFDGGTTWLGNCEASWS